MASSQHRCVFVGNIPYDATEEQLVEICQEVGPVVSFRLVIDRETGKPKGYGFCEYKDEETALSARRNLQGYEINGRQLRVDFAENEKGADRNREQGRGGPGLAPNIDPQKQVGGPANHGDSFPHQPIGLHIAITAASVMAGALGGAQAGIQSKQNSLHSQSALAHDPLTLHLAKMSRGQLIEVMSELKAMASTNKELARQLLLSRPQLPKAVFQAEIMLGMVTPQVLQMPNLRQGSGQPIQNPANEGQLGQPAVIQSLTGLPPPVPSKLQSGLVLNVPESQTSFVHQSPLMPNQFVGLPKAPIQPRVQLSQPAVNHVVSQGPFPGQANSTIPAVRPQSLPASVGPGIATTRSSMLPHVPLSDASFQVEDPSGVHRNSAYSNMPFGTAEKTNMVQGSTQPNDRLPKLMKPEDGRSALSAAGLANVSVPNGLSRVSGAGPLPVNAIPSRGELQYSNQQSSQTQLPPDVENVLLQQVLNLTPEQLNSLPPEQREQVVQLQQALRLKSL